MLLLSVHYISSFPHEVNKEKHFRNIGLFGKTKLLFFIFAYKSQRTQPQFEVLIDKAFEGQTASNRF